MTEPFITGVLVQRSEFSNGRNRPTSLLFDVTFEYADRAAITLVIRDAREMAETLEALNLPDRAVTLILQNGGYVARQPQ